LARALQSAPAARIALNDGARTVAYGELVRLIELEAGWLHAAGVARVALLAENGVPWAISDLALQLGAGLCVPLPGSFTPAQMAHALDDADIDALLTDVPAAASSRLSGWSASGVARGSGLTLLRRRLERSDRVAAMPRGTCKITYTSGSTAAPKGVCLAASHLEDVAAALAGATQELAIERHLCVLPLATLLENVAGLYAPLLAGATCVLPSSAGTGMSYAGLDVARLLAAIVRNEPNSLILVPELLQVLVTACERGWRAPDSLRFVAVGGAAVSPSLLQRATAVGLPVFEGYGLSECASVVCLNTPRAFRAGTVGRPLAHARVRVDAAGQVFVSGPAMLGYVGQQARTPGAEIATGDLGAFDDDGYLRLHGRAGNLFITSFGRNVSPEWVECELGQRLGGSPVFAHGEARPFVVALVSATRAQVDDDGVDRAIAAANAALPDYAQVRRWARAPRPFSVEDGLLTGNGRLRRREILARHRTLLDTLYGAASVG
jgi:long-subunit acyl-CoA synthetase (AMP-forming)